MIAVPQPLPPEPCRRRRRRRPAAWAVYAALPGQAPATIEAKVHGRAPLQEELARVLAGAIRTGNLWLLAKVMDPIEHALTGLPVPPLGPELLAQVRAAELAGIQAEIAYASAPDREKLRAWHRARCEAAAVDRTLRLALAQALAEP